MFFICLYTFWSFCKLHLNKVFFFIFFFFAKFLHFHRWNREIGCSPFVGDPKRFFCVRKILPRIVNTRRYNWSSYHWATDRSEKKMILLVLIELLYFCTKNDKLIFVWLFVIYLLQIKFCSCEFPLWNLFVYKMRPYNFVLIRIWMRQTETINIQFLGEHFRAIRFSRNSEFSNSSFFAFAFTWLSPTTENRGEMWFL